MVYSRAIGYSQISGNEKKPLTAANRFRIVSITKMFTASMILQLVEEGKLKRTDSLDKFLPQVPNARKITIEQILWHRSGIPNVKREPNAQGNVNTIPVTKEEMLALILKATPHFEPDTKRAHSNSGNKICIGGGRETRCADKSVMRAGRSRLESLWYITMNGGSKQRW